jgi:tRNA-Thr(GGU) m(6)t(6)A37 methyltransferase TsaA
MDEGWRSIEAEIHLSAEFKPGLKELESFSHAIILTWLHQAGFDIQRDLIRRPRGKPSWPEVGIFAQRAKHRPNPIGMSVVDIVSCENGILRVKGLDAINETPVIDIKPYYAAYDRVDAPGAPAWVSEVMVGYFE